MVKKASRSGGPSKPEPESVPEAQISEALPQHTTADPGAIPKGPNLDWIFEYHAPSEDQVDKYNEISAAAKNLASVIIKNCPPCADSSDALRKVREARFAANSSIALHGAI